MSNSIPAPSTDLPPAEINAHTMANVVKIAGGVSYQNPNGGPPQVLVSSEELDEQRITQDYWIRERKRELGIGGRFG